MKGLPNQIEGFLGDHPNHHQLLIADTIAYGMIVAVLLILIWTIYELYKGNKLYQMAQAH